MDTPGPGKSGEHHLEGTILIADDDSAIVTFLAELLRRNRFAVLTASDGAQALTVARDHGSTIDLLLTDFEMPHLTGVQLATAVRQLFPQISVVLMSGSPNRAGTAESVSIFLKKPFTPVALLETISTVLGRC